MLGETMVEASEHAGRAVACLMVELAATHTAQ
jgi:hypothetical protein